MQAFADVARPIWGKQTALALEHFAIGEARFPVEFIRAYGALKAACATANAACGSLPARKARAIRKAALEVYRGLWDGQFPLSVFQSGSGTQTHMNLNEVIARRARRLGGGAVHPNDDVNRSQSTNDTFPTVMHLSATLALEGRLHPPLLALESTLRRKSRAYRRVLKIGRTHLQDAVPLTFGQEISGWAEQLRKARARIDRCREGLREVALGGSAVGTGLNVPPGFPRRALAELREMTGLRLRPAHNRFEAMAAHDAIAALSSALRGLAAALLKVSDDIRWLASGPTSGLGEIAIPANEPGSSIMPGKVNPTQCESLSMVALQVFGLDSSVAIANSQGRFELNAYKPLIIYDVLLAIRLLADACASFDRHCARGIRPLPERMRSNVESSLMIAARLSPALGYEKVARLVKAAQSSHRTLRESAAELGYLRPAQYDRLMRPGKRPREASKAC